MTPDRFLWFVLVALASYRLAYLTAVDNGPGFIFLRWRTWVDHRFGENSWQTEGATCVFCQSVWYAAIGAAALQFIDLVWVQVVVSWLALAGVSVLIHWGVLSVMRRLEG